MQPATCNQPRATRNTPPATDLSILWTPHPIGARIAPNRLVSQAMEAGAADPGGAPSERIVARYAQLAAGGWGVLFVEATSVTTRSMGRLHGLALTDENAPAWERLVAACKAASPTALLLVQLTHSGRQSHPGTARVAACPNPPEGYRYLSTEEVAEIRDQHVHAAHLAEAVGFDGIDYKACHGYLGTELLRPRNTRPDRWGGSFANRARFVLEGLAEIAARRSSPGFLLGARLNWAEGSPGGVGTRGPESREYDPAETMELIRRLAYVGADYVNISGDVPDLTPYPDVRPEEARAHTLLAERLAKTLVVQEGLGLVVIGAGYSTFRAESPAIAAARLRAGYTDLVGWGRQSFADPLFPAQLRTSEKVLWCTACSACMTLMLDQHHAGCVVHDPFYRQVWREYRRAKGITGNL